MDNTEILWAGIVILMIACSFGVLLYFIKTITDD